MYIKSLRILEIFLKRDNFRSNIKTFENLRNKLEEFGNLIFLKSLRIPVKSFIYFENLPKQLKIN